jgi:hypothetical protein
MDKERSKARYFNPLRKIPGGLRPFLYRELGKVYPFWIRPSFIRNKRGLSLLDKALLYKE